MQTAFHGRYNVLHECWCICDVYAFYV